jgi:hypothetical protein
MDKESARRIIGQIVAWLGRRLRMSRVPRPPAASVPPVNRASRWPDSQSLLAGPPAPSSSDTAETRYH